MTAPAGGGLPHAKIIKFVSGVFWFFPSGGGLPHAKKSSSLNLVFFCFSPREKPSSRTRTEEDCVGGGGAAAQGLRMHDGRQ